MGDQSTSVGQPGAKDPKLAEQPNSNIGFPNTTYVLSADQATFFKAQTGIHDDDDLRTHIIAVQKRAMEVCPWGTTKYFTFLRLEITELPSYERIIELGQERPNELFLELGCCFGTESRKVVADGFPLKNVVTSDLRKEFHDLGHTLFNTTPETYPISFVPGDSLNPDILRIVPPFKEPPPAAERPDLSTLTSLNPLAGRCSVIYSNNFFHVFSEEDQLHLAKALAGLLSPQPGSMICGRHVGNHEKRMYHGEVGGDEYDMFQHSPESWSALWDGEVFAKGSVRVNVKVEVPADIGGGTFYIFLWSVVRL